MKWLHDLHHDEAGNQQSCGHVATQGHESGESFEKRRRNRWDPLPEEGGVENEGECVVVRRRDQDQM